MNNEKGNRGNLRVVVNRSDYRGNLRWAVVHHGHHIRDIDAVPVRRVRLWIRLHIHRDAGHLWAIKIVIRAGAMMPWIIVGLLTLALVLVYRKLRQYQRKFGRLDKWIGQGRSDEHTF